MNKNYCYTPQDEDRKIAERLFWNPKTNVGAYNPHVIALLRGLYDSENENELDITNIEEAARILSSYRASLVKKAMKQMKGKGATLAQSYKDLRIAFTAEEQFNRVTMLSTVISSLVTNMQKKFPSVSRLEILEGFEIDGKKYGGQLALFETAHEYLVQLYSRYSNMPHGEGKEYADKIAKVLNHYGALSTYVRIRLRDTEGLKLSNSEDIVSEAYIDNLDENALADLLNVEESKREHYQEANEMKSAWGSLGEQVRRILCSTPECTLENGKLVIKKDDLGFAKMLDGVRVHQKLLDMFRGMISSKDMLTKMENLAAEEPWIEAIRSTLISNPTLTTKFFVDLKKNFQLYSIMYRDKSKENKGIKYYKTIILNKTRNLLTGAFNLRILNTPLNEDSSIYNKEGKFIKKNVEDLRDLLQQWLVTKQETNQKAVTNTKTTNIFDSRTAYVNDKSAKFRKQDRYAQIDFLVKVSRDLGIDMDAQSASSIIRKGKDRDAYLTALKNLIEYGLNPVLSNSNLLNSTYSSVLRNTDSKSLQFREHIDKMNAILSRHREGLRIDSKVITIDSKGNSISLFSNINPCYMGDKFELITGYIEKDDKENLKKFLEENYLNSSYFKQGENVMNFWLKDLYDACNDKNMKLGKLGEIFTYKRLLGTPDLDFEQFTAKHHAINMIQEYFSDQQISSSSTTAMYPIFILGDSGVAKYVRQSRYPLKSDDNRNLLEGFYNIYLQEIEEMKSIKAVNKQLKELGGKLNGYTKTDDEGNEVFVEGQGYSKIENFSERGYQFSYLPFLNTSKYALSDNHTKDEVISKIEEYLNDAFAEFEKRLKEFGVLDTKTEKIKDKEVTKYVELNQILGSLNEDGVREKLFDFYANVKFATIQQMQLMTISPAFYKNVKDLQKRYKEIHAPGSILDIRARDFNNNLYSEDATETCIYFEDIETGANKDFLEVIARTYGKDSKIYKDYSEKNTLTDGQGYRSISSYRKVMGMAGLWTEEMENAYNTIMSIRQTYGKGEIPKEELAKIENLGVIFQPIKPYMFTHEHLAINKNDSQLIPVQHKYAEAVLIPELLPMGSKLRDMAYYMEENNIDLIGSTKICKVGCFGTTSIDNLSRYDEAILERHKANNIDEENISNTERLNFALSQAYVHKLSYLDYRIQTNVPEHTHASQLFGTQVRKLIMAGVLKFDRSGKLIDKKDSEGHYQYEHYADYEKITLDGKSGPIQVSLSSRNLLAFYNSLIVANQLVSYEKFEKAIQNESQLSEKLIQNIISNSRESVDNILAFALEDDSFAMPLFEGSLGHDTMSLLLSIYKKLVNKQTINGGSAVQVSALGIKDYSEDGGLNLVTDEKHENVLYAECEIPFNFNYQDSKGNTIELNFDDYCNPDGTPKMKDGEMLLEKDFPGITNIIAYRIPTERAYSMINLKAVRFSRKTAGGTIKVPVACTTIAGFDFDIDKLYFMRKEFIFKTERAYDNLDEDTLNKIWSEVYKKHPNIYNSLREYREKYGNTYKSLNSYWDEVVTDYNKNELFVEAAKSLEIDLGSYIDKEVLDSEYNYNMTPLANARVSKARTNNMLLHLIQQRLQDPETLEARTTPGGFTNASFSARQMRELVYGDGKTWFEGDSINWEKLEEISNDKSLDPEPNYDPSDPMTIITYNQQNQIASKLIGIFANHNTNHALASLLHTFKLRKGNEISFCGHTVEDGYGIDLLHGPEGVDIDLNLAEFLAASVDAVKDPVLNFLNFNTLTADSGALLARLGYNTTEIGLLLNQPIIKEVCEYAFNNSLRLEESIRDIVNKYVPKNQSVPIYDSESNIASKDSLAINIRQFALGRITMDSESFKNEQLQILSLFKSIVNIASEVSQFVTSTKFTASNAVGSTEGDMYAQQMKVANYVANQRAETSVLEVQLSDITGEKLPITDEGERLIWNSEEYANRVTYNPLAYEQTMYDLNRKALKSLSKYFPYETELYVNTREIFKNLTKSKYLDADTINSIHRDLLVFLLSRQYRSEFNGNLIKGKDINGDSVSVYQYYTQYFAKEVFDFLEENPQYRTMPIFEYMIHEVDNKGFYTMNVQGIGGLAPYIKESIKNSWADLVRLGEQEKSKGNIGLITHIAKDLFLYNFYKLGFDFSPVAFMNLAPIELKKSLLVQGQEEDINRTYTDFLNAILEGKIYDKDIDTIVEFAKFYLLNHSDNYRLVYQATSKSALNALKPLYMKDNMVQSSFTLDVTSKGNNYSMLLLEAEDGYYSFVPAIKINNELYIANQTSNGSFNISFDGKMTYIKAPILGSKTSKNYSYNDLNDAINKSNVKEDKPRKYIMETSNVQESIEESEDTVSSEGNTSIESEITPTVDRSTLIKNIVQVFIANTEGVMAEDANNMIASLNAEFPGDSIYDAIKDIRETYKSKGQLTLDAEGNVVKLC
jgi:hypothetical protein